MDIRKYIYSHCVSPTNMKVWDSYTQSYVTRSIPCGKCLHCKNTHINEWCARLFAQRQYSKFCYYVSLDYAPFTLSDPVAMQLARETAACYHNINKNDKYGMHPLVLCKNHLQDFYKRLRKNTNIKLQYFACGEYGMHANGRGFGRPHFHNIIFSNEPISFADFERAWTIDGYKIGRVDLVDMNGITFDSNENLKIFKYVCKYIQKSDFDFEKLATIDFHRTYFESLHLVCEQNDLFSASYVLPFSGLSDTEKDKLWREYIAAYSPFIVCSRRPAIGSSYLADHLERFTKQDFRLFGLPMGGLAFPRYFLRKAKESLYPYMCLGRESEKPSSESRMGCIVQVLSFIYNTRLSLENWQQNAAFDWRVCYASPNGRRERCLRYAIDADPIPLRSLSFYDSKNKFMYQFNGYHYNVWAKIDKGVYSLLDNMDIIDVLHEIRPSWDRFHSTWIKPLHDMRVLSENDLTDYVTNLYKPTSDMSSLALFREEVHARYKVELETRYKTKMLMSNSKQNL